MVKQNTLTKFKKKERQFRRDLIISAAREVLGKKSYNSFSMAEIARAAMFNALKEKETKVRI